MKQIEVIDSHTGGEPTRVIISGGPDLGTGTMAERLEVFRRDHDHLRAAMVLEPRGSDVWVGALLCEPVDRHCAAGVIFFNNVGYLGMCGHGTIGLAVTLAHRGLIGPGDHALETPVGQISFTLHNNHRVSLDNVPSYRYRKAVAVEVEGIGIVVGDIAWGGNWFFLVADHGQALDPANTDRLVDYCWRLRQALARAGIRGKDGAEIDHIELFGQPSDPAVADSRNFVLCPGKAYDRSPCGTGTSAKLACLYADGRLKKGESWRQESIVGSVFEGRVRIDGEKIIPTITGNAYISAETKLMLEPEDPFVHGINN